MNTETQKAAKEILQEVCSVYTDKNQSGYLDIKAAIIDGQVDMVLEAMEKYAIHKSIYVLNDNISRLKAQAENIIQKRLDYQSFPTEFARLSGKEEEIDVAIENLRQEIQSLTSQLNEL